MGKSLIIVESPTKIKTLKKFLGERYVYESSVGHIRDLPEKGFGIDIDADFEPTYEIMADKKAVIDRLRRAAKKADVVYLSPDPDREGEAIAWHIMQILPEGTDCKRVSFNSITKEAVSKALLEPREIDQALVDAQQARRLLDRIVGYKISPILNRRVGRGKEGSVSAGRVQSVALKLVVDREKEIEAFKPVEFWNIAALLQQAGDQPFKAILHSVDGQRVEKEEKEDKPSTTIPNQATAEQIVAKLEKAQYQVGRVERKEKRRNPVAPFITSTLQQEASRHLGFQSNRTMQVAQSLYEGVDLGADGSEGLITYMRTDSVRVAPEAIAEVRHLIGREFGSEYLPAQPRLFATKKSAQDAHEAIRPTSLQHTPDKVKRYLTREQFLLYSLVWKRFVASQMNPAVYDTLSADIETDQGIVLRATGSLLKFAGFLRVYEEKRDDDRSEEEGALPALETGNALALKEVTSEQAFTKPPPRYSEASLVKELERLGIGRPSTYASIMSKIQGRDYTTRESGRLRPTELGRVIAQLLEENFGQIVNVGFTAQMEEELESVAEATKNWRALLKAFWSTFEPTLELAEKGAFVPRVETDIDCPQCGGKLQKIWWKGRYFYGCGRYPECTYRAAIEQVDFKKEDYAADFNWEQKCPQCGSEMKLRHGRFGAFLGCSRYPECKGIVNIPKVGEEPVAQGEMPSCPAKGCDGHLVARRSRFNKTFYSCSNYPACDVIVNRLEDLATKYADHPKTPYQKAERKGKRAKGEKAAPKGKGRTAGKITKESPFNRPLKLSKELSQLLGAEELSQGEVMKGLWKYIKANNLQNPKDGRQILPNAALAKVFGSSEPIGMFSLAKVLKPHMK